MKKSCLLLRMELLKLRALKMMLFVLIGAVAFLFIGSFAGIGLLMFLYLWIYIPAAYDEQNQGEWLQCILPVSRGQVVIAKYLYDLTGVFIMGIAAMIVQLVSTRVVDGTAMRVGFFGQAPLYSAGMVVGAGLLFIGIVRPLLLWLGVTRARYFVMGIYILSVAGSSTVAEVFMEENGVVTAMQSGSNLLPWIGVVVLVVSYLVAQWLYRKREIF